MAEDGAAREPVVGRVLVVDDNRMNRMTLQRGVEQLGHEVTTAESGEEALALLRAEAFDAVLLDIVMPGMDGFEVLATIKADPQLRDIPVVVISAVDEMDAVARCIEMGADDYLPKPFDPVVLRARLRAGLGRKQLRDLERAYLQQEVLLRQQEKLASIGRLSAGLAHEINNPAAAAQRGSGLLAAAVSRLQAASLELARAAPGDDLLDLLVATEEELARAVVRPDPLDLDPLARSDREAEMEGWLADRGVEEPWELAEMLVTCPPEVLERLDSAFDGAALRAALAWVGAAHTVRSLVAEIGEASGRVASLVGALKRYTYLDQAPVQEIDVHEGIDTTLVMLRGQLRDGVTVERDYATDLPRITAAGSELNQVWTNLLVNAVEAMGGKGRLAIRTRTEGGWLVVEVEDDGPGIPATILPRVFDPFVTTKPPGEGTGLGLNLVHATVVERHGGQVEVVSEPGRTCFAVRLPLAASVE